MHEWKGGLMIMVVIAVALVVPTQPTQAADWCTCQVNEAGPTGTGTVVKIYLTDVAEAPVFDGNTAFKAQTGREKEMLAVALVALSNDLKVRAQLDLKNKKILTLNLAATESQ